MRFIFFKTLPTRFLQNGSICLLFLLAFLLNACQSESVKLSFYEKTNDSLNYRLNATLQAIAVASTEQSIDTLSATAADNPESMSSKLFLKANLQTLAAYDDSSARYQVKIDTVAYHSDKRTPEEISYTERYLKRQSFQYKMRADGEIVSAPDIDQFVPVFGVHDLDITKLFLKIQPIFPARSLEVGENWERQQAYFDGKNNEKQITVYKMFTLEEIFMRDGVRLAKIKMGVKYKQFSEDVSLKLESVDMVVGEGTVLFDISNGRIETVSLEINGNIKVSDKVLSKNLPNLHIKQTIKMERF